jgi:hypothetical protein
MSEAINMKVESRSDVLRVLFCCHSIIVKSDVLLQISQLNSLYTSGQTQH